MAAMESLRTREGKGRKKGEAKQRWNRCVQEKEGAERKADEGQKERRMKGRDERKAGG